MEEGVEELDRSLLWIGYIILSGIIFGIIVYALFDIGTGRFLYKDLYSKDNSLLISSIATSNGEVNLEYNVKYKPGEFDIILKENCEVRVSSKDTITNYKVSYCLDNENIQITESKVNLNKIKISLKDDKLILEEI